MSQDLLAAFNDVVPSENIRSRHALVELAVLSHHANPIEQEDDSFADEEFGDFEDAEALPASINSPPDSHTAVPDVLKTPNTNSNASAVKATPPTNLPFKPKQPETTQNDSRIGRHPFAEHMDVLFAADDNEYDAGQDEWHDLSNNPEAAMAYSKRIIQEQMDAQARQDAQSPGSLVGSTQPTFAKPTKSPEALKPRNLDVLFDADDLSDNATPEDEDGGDWGNFEAPSQITIPGYRNGQRDVGKPTSHAPYTMTHEATAIFDLLGLDEPVPAAEATKIDSAPEPADITRMLAPRPSIARSAASFNKIIKKGFIDAAWDDFDDTIQSNVAVTSTDDIRRGSIPASMASLPTIPPANVPPPSILLSTFPDLLKQPLSQETIEERVSNATVLAHIIAGRKQRWKRSSALAASMRIGPAAAGGKGGMKLTGLDRNETAKEDREVAEVLSAWRAQLGRLRSAFASHTSASAEGKLLQAKLPEVSDPAPIKTLKPQEGGLSAPHECALCGLKRQERVVNVDDNVDDSFGEWWSEGPDMHMLCLTWWIRHEALLRSR